MYPVAALNTMYLLDRRSLEHLVRRVCLGLLVHRQHPDDLPLLGVRAGHVHNLVDSSEVDMVWGSELDLVGGSELDLALRIAELARLATRSTA